MRFRLLLLTACMCCSPVRGQNRPADAPVPGTGKPAAKPAPAAAPAGAKPAPPANPPAASASKPAAPDTAAPAPAPAPAPEKVGELTVPERPADHVLDQTGKVTTEERRVVSGTLESLAKQDSLGVYLVLLNSAAEEPPADVARRLAQNWRVTADTAVIISVPGATPSMLIEVAGVALTGLKDEELQGMKDRALAAAGKSPAGIPAMLMVANAFGAEVQKFRAGNPLESGAQGASAENPASHLAAWIAGGALACCLAALLLMRRGRHHALIFPPTEPRHRFSAPHSGGNDAMVSFGKREN